MKDHSPKAVLQAEINRLKKVKGNEAKIKEFEAAIKKI